MQDKAGELFERMGLVQQAMEAYEKGRAYRKAVELAKIHRPTQVRQTARGMAFWVFGVVPGAGEDPRRSHFLKRVSEWFSAS